MIKKRKDVHVKHHITWRVIIIVLFIFSWKRSRGRGGAGGLETNIFSSSSCLLVESFLSTHKSHQWCKYSKVNTTFNITTFCVIEIMGDYSKESNNLTLINRTTKSSRVNTETLDSSLCVTRVISLVCLSDTTTNFYLNYWKILHGQRVLLWNLYGQSFVKQNRFLTNWSLTHT